MIAELLAAVADVSAGNKVGEGHLAELLEPSTWTKRKELRYWGLRAGQIAESNSEDEARELEALEIERAAE